MSSKNYEHLLSWLKRTKEHLCECFDSKCGICGYDRCIEAMDFHHVNPEEKKFNVSSWSVKSWDKLCDEVRKCVLLCACCHREFHAGMIEIPHNIKRFEENTFKQIAMKREKVMGEVKLNKCLICSNMKNPTQKYCSIECRSKNNRRVDWDKYNLYDLIVVQDLPMTEIAKRIGGVTDNAVRKRAKKLGLPVTIKDRKEYQKLNCKG